MRFAGRALCAGADSLFIAGATYYEPGASGPGGLDRCRPPGAKGYAGEAIGSVGDLVVTLSGQNIVVETSAPDVDISRCGMEVWGDLTLRGSGSLVATGSQCGIYVSGTLAVDGCKVDARADGAGIADARAAGVIADGLAIRGGGRVVAAGAGSGRACAPMVCLPGGAAGGGRPGSLPSMRPGWMRRAPTAASPAWAGRLHPRALWRLRAGPLARAAWWMPTGPWRAWDDRARGRCWPDGGDRWA